MPTFEITAPDGTKYRVTGPEGSTEVQALERVKAEHGGAAPEKRSAVGEFFRPLTELPGNVAEEFRGGAKTAQAGIEDVQKPGVLSKAKGAGEMALGGFQEATSPVTAAIKSFVGDPVKRAVPGKAGELLSEGASDVVGLLGPSAVGKGVRAVGKALPGISKEVRALMGEGVELTPGQIAGGIPRRAEEAFKSFPILGSFIRKAEGRSVESFNRAVIDQALAPITRQLPKGTSAGHEAISYADKAFDEAYNRIKAQITFRPDSQFLDEMNEIRQATTELPAQLREQFDAIMKNRLFAQGRMGPGGVMSGEQFKLAESDLGRIAAQYRSSPDPAQRALAHAVDEVKLTLRSTLARANPDQAEQLSAINSGYAMLVRAEGAAARRATSTGIFTPSDLLQTIKSADRSVRKVDFAKGDSLMQEFAESAHKVLGNKLPDSGTFERAAWDVGAATTGLVRPEIPLGLLGASLPYTSPGIRALNAGVRAAPRAAESATRALERSGPFVGAAEAASKPQEGDNAAP